MLGRFVVVTLIACACADDGAPAADATPPSPDAAPGPVLLIDCEGVTPAATITTAGMTYVPADVMISAGDVISFEPAGTHDLASDDGLFDTGIPPAPGCLLFREPGTYPYHCSVHQPMRGTIVVQ